jgi:hypothetical protein
MQRCERVALDALAAHGLLTFYAARIGSHAAAPPAVAN